MCQTSGRVGIYNFMSSLQGICGKCIGMSPVADVADLPIFQTGVCFSFLLIVFSYGQVYAVLRAAPVFLQLLLNWEQKWRPQ